MEKSTEGRLKAKPKWKPFPQMMFDGRFVGLTVVFFIICGRVIDSLGPAQGLTAHFQRALLWYVAIMCYDTVLLHWPAVFADLGARPIKAHSAKTLAFFVAPFAAISLVIGFSQGWESGLKGFLIASLVGGFLWGTMVFVDRSSGAGSRGAWLGGLMSVFLLALGLFCVILLSTLIARIPVG